MTRQLSITISDHVYEEIFSEFEGNRSQRIEGLLQKGLEMEMDYDKTMKSKLRKLLQEKMKLSEGIVKRDKRIKVLIKKHNLLIKKLKQEEDGRIIPKGM
jgi:type III secretion system FlhB-like substrate exporter